MASFYGHITTSAVLGGIVGGVGSYYFGFDWGSVFLAAGLTTIGGMLPDLDSDSGIPARELFGLAGVFVPLLLFERLKSFGLTMEQLLVVLAATYLLVRYGVAALFKRITVHRGMFHSIPALFISGLAIFLMHCPEQLQGDELRRRLYYAVGTMIGFLSHLVLDEIFAVDLMGLVPKLNQFAGSALKLKSDSWVATLFTYAILIGLAYLAWASTGSPTQWDDAWVQTVTPMKK
jgi:hypothetical protein